MFYIGIALAAALFFGASTPLSKLLLESLPPFQLAGFLYLGAALGVVPFSIGRRGKRMSMGRKNMIYLGGAILFGGILGPVAVLFGLQLASSASVAMWLNLELAATAILGVIFFKDHLGRPGWAGVCGTLVASLLLSWQEGSSGPAAMGFLVAAGICWGMDNHLTALIDGISPSQSTFYKGIAAGLTNICISLGAEPFSVSLVPLAGALGVGAVAYGISISLYILSAQNLGATRSQMVFATSPFFGVLLSMLVLGESITGLQLVAAGILALSLATLFRDNHGHAHTHGAAYHNHRHAHDDGHHEPGHHLHGSEDGEPDARAAHSHWHRHQPTTHSHTHLPDLHHRHRH